MALNDTSLLHTVTKNTHGAAVCCMIPSPAIRQDLGGRGLMCVLTAALPCCSNWQLQVFERLISSWCPSGMNELLPGFKTYAVQQLGGQACVLGLLGNLPVTTGMTNGPGPSSPQAAAPRMLDARDAVTVTFLGEVGCALKLLHERCGDELSIHLCNQVLPGSGLPPELQQQLVRHVRDSDAREVKEFLRQLLLSARAAGLPGK